MHTNETWNKEIVIGGTPLTLYEIEEIFMGEFDGLSKRAFAIEVIKKIDVSPVEPSAEDEFSFVWNGTRLSMSQDIDGKLYLDLGLSADSSLSNVPTYELLLQGIPLATGPEREIIFYDSGYATDDIEKYKEMFIGGMPHTVGQIGNKWYWVIHPIS